MNLPSAHSPLGASGAYRWLVCPGSISLSEGVADEESDFAALGTAAHELAATCLKSDTDPWLNIGATIEGIVVDPDMTNAVQDYLNAVRWAHPDRNQGNFWVEEQFHCPEVHELFYGTADCVYFDEAARVLHVWDYKHGAGVVVEVQWNPQTMYYGIGALTYLDLWGSVDQVVLHIAQPRAFHASGGIREWAISVDDLEKWRDEVLVPGMERALTSDELVSGPHCQFCPARTRACPQLMADMEELDDMVKMMKKAGGAPELTNEQVGHLLDVFETAKIAAKAARETGYARAVKGAEVPGWKLVKGRANRAWKHNAETAAKKQFGADAYEPKKLRSPAQMEKLPKGTAFTTKYAEKPDAGLQLVPRSEGRAEISPSTKSMFKPIAKGKKSNGKK